MNRKNMPIILMLLAGAVTGIITFIMHYSIIKRLLYLLIALILFYILGNVLKWVLDSFDKQNEIAALEKGEVIEKEPGTEEAEHKST